MFPTLMQTHTSVAHRMTDRPVVSALQTVWSSISELCAGIEGAEWERPTECPGWSVKDNVSHMIGTELMLAGRPAPSAAPAGLAHVKNPIGVLNEAWVEERRGRDPASVRTEFDAVTAERLTALRAMGDDDFARQIQTPVGPGTYELFMQIRAFDCWMHEQDMRRALGRPGHQTGPVAELSIARLTSGLGFVVGKKLAAPEGTSVVVEITGPIERTLAVRVEGGRAQALDPPPAEPTVRVRMDTEPFVCLAGGRWTGTQALERGRVGIEGNKDLGAALVSALAIVS